MEQDLVRVHGEQLPKCVDPQHPHIVGYEHGQCPHCHNRLDADSQEAGVCPECRWAIDNGLLRPDDKFQSSLRNVLLGNRWDDQGGYVSYSGDGNWGFVTTSLQATPEMLNSLFELAGIRPHKIERAGHCVDCKWADSKGRERGYVEPCLSCKRPRLSNFETK